MQEYILRNENLLLLGFKDYRAYLRSKLWKSIRAAQLERDPFCYGCGKHANQVHHANYSMEILNGTSVIGLYSICGRCHRWIEITRGGYKRSPEEATAELFRVKRIKARQSLSYRRRQGY